MSSTIAEITKFVKKRVGARSFDSMLEYLNRYSPNLWGSIQPRSYLQKNLVLLLFKDIKKIGYTSVMNTIKPIISRMNTKTFRINCQKIRKRLYWWAIINIKLGRKRDWKRAADGATSYSKFDHVYIWIDSVDFPKEKRRPYSTKDSDWSFKLKGKGRRYMFVRNARGKILKIWGGYSPKLFDGNFIELLHNDIDKEFAGAHFIGDSHFEYGNQFLTNVKIWTNANKNDPEDSEGAAPISKTKKSDAIYLRQHRRLRARVENGFGIMSQLFASLAIPWSEDVKQLDYLVHIAAAILNIKLS